VETELKKASKNKETANKESANKESVNEKSIDDPETKAPAKFRFRPKPWMKLK
jgi:hypothetical protein